MMKKGFTLAEVLITLSIIGVVSALTLPNLSSGYSRQVTATQLSKAVNTLENANALALQNEEVSDLKMINPSKTGYYFQISNVLKAVQLPSGIRNNDYKSYNNTILAGGAHDVAPGRITFETKDGMTFVQFPSVPIPLSPIPANLNQMYSGTYWKIYVDINGNSKKPNVLGKDLFLLHVDTYGTVIPHGGTQWASYIKPDNPDPPLWQTECTKATVSANDGAACAGAIVDNGYVVNYF